MKSTFMIFLVILFNIVLCAQNAIVTFVVKTNKLNDSLSVYVAGNEEELGEWDPSEVKLKKEGENSWKIQFSFPRGTKLEYKYTLGGWNLEALDDKGETKSNSKLTVSNDTIISEEVNKWGTSAPKRIPFKGQITGEVRYHRNFKGEGLPPRDIIVWLPPSYKKEKLKRYPVLYAHDGQNLFDPSTSAFGMDWQLDETADSLIRKGKINEIIIVGINNTPYRMKEYYTGDTGETYLKFVVNKLKPFIDKTYRTLPDRKNTASMGSSAGGLISFMLVWQYNDIFSKAACLSPAFFIKGLDYITPVLKSKGERRDIKVYMDCGGVGLDSLLLAGTEKMLSVLKGKRYKKGKDYLWYFDKTGEHNEENWARRLWRPLEFFYGTK